MAETIVPKRTYVEIWIALLTLTAITAWLSFYNFGRWSAVVAMTIACTKAALVVFFFMHMRYEKLKIVWVVAVAGLFWLFILFIGNLADYLTRQWIGTPGH